MNVNLAFIDYILASFVLPVFRLVIVHRFVFLGVVPFVLIFTVPPIFGQLIFTVL